MFQFFFNSFQLLVVHFSVILTCPSLELLLYNFTVRDTYCFHYLQKSDGEVKVIICLFYYMKVEVSLNLLQQFPNLLILAFNLLLYQICFNFHFQYLMSIIFNIFQILVWHFFVILTCSSLKLVPYAFLFCDSYFLIIFSDLATGYR